LDLDFAEACYVSGLPFTVYQDKAMQRGFRRLNTAYKPPNRKALAGLLLDKVYSQVKERVDSAIQDTKLLNVITDGSTNINNARIVNISIHTPSGAFHWRSEESERVDKLTYIYINTRIFRRINMEILARDFNEFTEEEVELEDELLQMEEMSDIDEFEGNES
jgi:Protein of unknown function (DUF 659)